MKYIMQFILIVVLVPLVFAQSVQDSLTGDIQLKTFIESDDVAQNREVIYHVELKWQGELSRYKINKVNEPTISNLTTRGSGSSNKILTGANGAVFSIKRITFYFQPIEMGMAYIDGVTIKYEDVILEKEESLISSRIGVKIIDPIPESPQGLLSLELLYILLIIVVLGLIIYLYLRYKKKKNEEAENALMKPIETVEEKYLRLLKETIHFNADNIKDSLNDLSRLISGYFSDQYKISAQNLSTNDLMESLTDKDLSEELLGRVKEYFTKANLVKFAGESIIETDFHRLYDTVELILENQKSLHSEEEQ